LILLIRLLKTLKKTLKDNYLYIRNVKQIIDNLNDNILKKIHEYLEQINKNDTQNPHTQQHENLTKKDIIKSVFEYYGETNELMKYLKIDFCKYIYVLNDTTGDLKMIKNFFDKRKTKEIFKRIKEKLLTLKSIRQNDNSFVYDKTRKLINNIFYDLRFHIIQKEQDNKGLNAFSKFCIVQPIIKHQNPH